MAIRVVYFTSVPLGTTANGGALVCREHVGRIAATPGVRLTVCTTGPATQESGDAAFAASVGVRPAFFGWKSGPTPPPNRWPFLLESTAAAQRHVDVDFENLLAAEAPDLLVVDYLLSALFIPRSYQAGTRRLTITLNREARFFRELRQRGLVPSGTSPTLAAELRLAAFEQWVHLRSHMVAALTPGDLPFAWPRLLRAVLPPLFPSRPRRWAPSGQQRLLFVGNIGHYPNRLAIEWIVTRLAPTLPPGPIRVRILGADAASVPPGWRRPNVDYLGIGDAALAEQEFCSADLFLAPIANAFGSKIKLLECLAYGTPFAATKAALSGIPFVRDVPEIDLDRPAEAMALVTSWLADPARLRGFSHRASAALHTQLAKRQDVWRDVLLAAAGHKPAQS